MFSSVVIVSGASTTAAGQETLTFPVVRLLKPVGTEQRLGKNRVPAINDQGLSTYDDMDQDELLELLMAEIADLGPGNALDPFKVGCPVDQTVQIKVWRYRVELGLRMECGWHPGEGHRWCIREGGSGRGRGTRGPKLTNEVWAGNSGRRMPQPHCGGL